MFPKPVETGRATNSTTSAWNAILIDTNVLVYMYDPRARNKQDQARTLVDRLISNERAVLSVQCLSEFFNVATRRLRPPLSRIEALGRIERFSHGCHILSLTPTVVVAGCRGSVQHNLSVWDGLIWAAASLNNIQFILTEDAENDRLLDGVRYLNPFAPDFDPGVLGLSR